MGTEKTYADEYFSTHPTIEVKLNNPLMGTET